MKAEVPRHRLDPEALRGLDACNRVLDFGQEGQNIAEIARISRGDPIRKDKAGRRLRRDAGLAAKLRGTIALAFEDGRNGQVVGIDQFTVTQFLAVGEPCGLLADVGMAAEHGGERLGDTLALGLTQCRRVVQEVLGLLPKRSDGLSQVQKLLFGVTHQCHKDLTLPPALAAKASHDFGQFLVERLGLTREACGAAAALLCDVCDERKGFFVLYTAWWHR